MSSNCEVLETDGGAIKIDNVAVRFESPSDCLVLSRAQQTEAGGAASVRSGESCVDLIDAPARSSFDGNTCTSTASQQLALNTYKHSVTVTTGPMYQSLTRKCYYTVELTSVRALISNITTMCVECSFTIIFSLIDKCLTGSCL